MYKSKKKISHYLQKALGLHKKDSKCFSLEIKGQRFYGKDLKDLKLDDGKLSFSHDGKSYQISECQICGVKRLRSRKYLFTAKLELKGKEDVKATPTPPADTEEYSEDLVDSDTE